MDLAKGYSWDILRLSGVDVSVGGDVWVARGGVTA